MELEAPIVYDDVTKVYAVESYTILEVLCEEDHFAAIGAPLLRVDIDDLVLSEKRLEFEIWKLDEQIKKATSGDRVYLEKERGLYSFELETLQRSIPEDGIIVVPEAGQVSSVLVEKGQKTMPGEVIAVIIPKDSQPYIEWSLPMETAKHINAGASVVATFMKSGQTEKTNMTIEISTMKWDQANGQYKYTAAIPSADLSLSNQMASIRLIQESDAYEKVIPKSAIHEDGGEVFVYFLKNRDGLFGRESVVQKADIDILDDNGKFVAIVCDEIQEQYLIVTDASGALFNGNVVLPIAM